jgi:non-homologous end joining protein Ku
VLIRDSMAAAKVVAVARTVMFRRVRSVLIRAHGDGLIAHTLNFDYEVRSADEAFSDLPATKADEDMLDLALHIIKKAGRFVRAPVRMKNRAPQSGNRPHRNRPRQRSRRNPRPQRQK